MSEFLVNKLVLDNKIVTATGKSIYVDGVLAEAYLAVVTETGNSRVLSLSDEQKWIRFTHATGATVTVPAQSSVAWTNNTEIAFEQAGAGKITFFTGTVGTTINSSSTYKTFGQYAVVGLKRVGSGVWTLFGERE